MGRSKKFDYQAVIENGLIAQPDGLTLDELLERSGLKVDRSTLFRHLTRLIELGRVERTGKARASRYRPTGVAGIREDLALPHTQPPAVPSMRESLERYLPNETPFLSPSEVQQLHQAGRVELPGVPPGTYARRIYERLAIDLGYASSKLEGGSYSLPETERLVRFGEVLADRDRREAVMILNHKEAIRFIVDNLASVDLARPDLLYLHALLSHGLLANPADSGRLRHAPAQIGGTAYPALDSASRLDEQFDLLLAKLSAVKEPFEKAYCLFVFLPCMRLFEDGDKGMSRVALNIPLLKHDLCPLSFIAVDERAYAEGISGVSESNDAALLKQVFIESYVRAAGNYRQVRAEPDSAPVPAPDYGAVVKKAVRTAVREWKRCSRVNLQIYLSLLAKPEHVDELAATVERELAGLHQGNLAEFGLSQADFNGFIPPASREETGE